MKHANGDSEVKLTVYTAGPMTGLPEFNYPAFLDAEQKLTARGFHVENPANNVPPADLRGDAQYDWFIRAGFKQVLNADLVAVLPGWERSRGARMEVQLAEWLNMPVYRLEDVLHLGPGDWLRSAKVVTLAEADAQPA